MPGRSALEHACVTEHVSPFEFLSAGRIVFGSGVASTLGERARKLGRRALWVTGKNAERVSALRATLEHAGVELSVVSVATEPRVEDVLQAVQVGRRAG